MNTTRALLGAVLAPGIVAAGCAGPRPEVPPVPPPTATCEVIDPGPPALPPPVPETDEAPETGDAPTAEPDGAPPATAPAAGDAAADAGAGAGDGPGLSRLLPGHGPAPGAPLKTRQLLSLERPPSELQWRALPPTADAELSAVAQDPAAPPHVRARALSGLAVRGTEGAVPTMTALLGEPGTDPAVRRAAARALGAGFVEAEGESGGPAQAALVAALSDPDPLVRETVVKALAPFAARPEVRAALAARLEEEPAAPVRAAIAQALETSKGESP